jgi:hypothetical protein
VAFVLVHDKVMSLSSVDAPQFGGVIVIDNRVAGPRGALDDVLLAGADEVAVRRVDVLTAVVGVVGAALVELGALDDAARLPLPEPVTVLEQAARLRLPANRTEVATAACR